MKIYLFYTVFFFSMAVSAQESAVDLYRSSSKDFKSFGHSIKNDSVFSFRSPKGYIPSLLHNLGYQATFPFRMKGRQFVMLGSSAVITLVLIKNDSYFDRKIRPIKENTPIINTISPQFTEIGDYYGYILLSGYGFYSLAFHKYRAFRVSLLASQAAISAGLWIRLGKILSGRMRPEITYTDKEFSSDHWFGPFAQFNSKYNNNRGIGSFDAFPSGHTGAAFAMATVISDEYKDEKAVPIVMYSIASLVAISRLIEHTHWTSDIFLGGLVGYLCGKQVVANEKKVFPKYRLANRYSKSYFYPVNFSGIYGAGWMLVF